MGPLKLLSFISLLTFNSCAKFGYIFEQGVGQLSLIARAIPNEKFLKDPDVSQKHKDKVSKIEQYKSYFYNYWDRDETKIYSRTTMLKQEAVTYLVIASPYNKIKAHKECFPIMGCFPYLGFFEKESAKEYATEMEEKDFVTYTRPVYAYSTLGYFTDTILSSFFYFKDYELAELIFHELFHTIFFVKDQVQLNENLANYFAKRMVVDYFKLSEEERKKKARNKRNREVLSLKVVELVSELNELYENLENKEQAKKVFDKFMATKFNPEVQKLCLKEKIEEKRCFPLKRKWNNASLAAFLTYEKKADQLGEMHAKLGLSLKDFFYYIERRYELFEKQRKEKDFSAFLFQTLKD